MKLCTHKAIGVVTYSGLVTHFYKPYSMGLSVVLFTSAFIAYISSTLPDIIEGGIKKDHRGYTHSFVWSVVVTAVASPFLYSICLLLRSLGIYYPVTLHLFAFWIGYTSHFLADFFTNNGVSMLWPFDEGRKGFRLWEHKDREIPETIIYLLSWLATWVIWYKHFSVYF